MNHAMLQTTRIAIRITGENLTDLLTPWKLYELRWLLSADGWTEGDSATQVRPTSQVWGRCVASAYSPQVEATHWTGADFFVKIWRSPFDTRYILIKTWERERQCNIQYTTPFIKHKLFLAATWLILPSYLVPKQTKDRFAARCACSGGWQLPDVV